MSKTRFKSVRIFNFGPLKAQDERGFHVDFEGADLVLVYGGTGEGKSVILEAIRWALYGMYAGSNSEYQSAHESLPENQNETKKWERTEV